MFSDWTFSAIQIFSRPSIWLIFCLNFWICSYPYLLFLLLLKFFLPLWYALLPSMTTSDITATSDTPVTETKQSDLSKVTSKDSLRCTYYKTSRHTRERCRRPHGKPPISNRNSIVKKGLRDKIEKLRNLLGIL